MGSSSAFARSELPATPLAVIAVAASCIRTGCGLVIVRHAIAMRRNTDAARTAEDGHDRR